ncbi:MAG: hypothetical protein AAF629_22165, partial [Chloroflexota bacterium]
MADRFLQVIDSPVERTTAATDLILAVIAAGLAVYVWTIGQAHPWKAGLWAYGFGLLMVAGLLGAITHGFIIPDRLKGWLWNVLFLSLGWVVAVAVVGAVYDVWQIHTARRVLPFMVLVGLLFFGVTKLIKGTFLPYVLYQGIGMLFALGCYIWLIVAGGLCGVGWMIAGILLTILASVVQASKSISLRLIWEFDHNGVYHLIQIVGLLFLG